MQIAFVPHPALLSTFLTDDFGNDCHIVTSTYDGDSEYTPIVVSEKTFTFAVCFSMEGL
jgi:hypothetical protein